MPSSQIGHWVGVWIFKKLSLPKEVIEELQEVITSLEGLDNITGLMDMLTNGTITRIK